MMRDNSGINVGEQARVAAAATVHTSLASTVTMLEVTGVARNIVARTFAPYEIFIAAALIYLVITWCIQRGFALLEARMSQHLQR